MSIRNLLVAYNGLEASQAALSGALLMQRHFGAHLTGLFAHGGSNLSHQLKPWMPTRVQDAILEAETQSARDIESRFRTACEEVPEGMLHWIDSAGAVHRTVAGHARIHDITVLGMHENAAHGQNHLEIYPDRVALESGRPVILFPPRFGASVFNRRAVVAWDGGRAAARALADAMQILEPGTAVDIVSVGRAPLRGTLADVDVRAVLERHDMPVTLSELPRDRRAIADILVDHCEATSANLLVMGAYEHSPLREGLIGGVTHDIALRARIPVLMSH